MTSNEDTAGEMGSQQRTIVAGMAAVGTLLAIAYVGYLVFEDPVYGAVAGAFSGAGTYFLFQYLLSGGLATDGSDAGATGGSDDAAGGSIAGVDQASDGRRTGGGVHAGAAGFAMDAGGVAMLAAGFATDGQLAIGVLAAVAVTLAGYVILDRTLPGPEP